MTTDNKVNTELHLIRHMTELKVYGQPFNGYKNSNEDFNHNSSLE